MKKIKIVLLIIMLVILYIYAVKDANIHNSYEIDAVVVANYNHWVMVKDINGNLWEFDGYGYNIGNKVKLSMYNNCSPNYIDDDIIENVTIL